MAYNLNDLVKLGALKNLAKRIADGYATKESVDLLDQRVDSLVTAGGEPNTIDVIKVNGTAQEITNKAVDLTIPTKVSDLNNDANYQTGTEVATAIAAGVAAADHLIRTKVTSVDAIDVSAEGADKYIYMVPRAGDKTGNKYDEYMVLDGELEKVGDWEVDLSGYVQKEDGKGLSTNDFTNEDKQKLDGIAEGATKVTTSDVSGHIKINGEDVAIVNIATDNEVGEMLNEIFGLPYNPNFSEHYDLSLPSEDEWVRFKSDGNFNTELSLNSSSTTASVANQLKLSLRNYGMTVYVDSSTGYIVVTSDETGETVDFTISVNNVVVYPKTSGN